VGGGVGLPMICWRMASTAKASPVGRTDIVEECLMTVVLIGVLQSVVLIAVSRTEEK
jgi:hypothetical protein